MVLSLKAIRTPLLAHNNKIEGNQSGAFGVGTYNVDTVKGDNSYSVGNKNQVSANNTFVVGNNVKTSLDNAVVLGNNSTAEVVM